MRLTTSPHSRLARAAACPRGRTTRPRRAGAAAVEFALVAPLLFMLVLGMLEFGRAMMVMEQLTSAARAGCRKGVLTGSATSDVQTAVNAALGNAGIPSTNVNTTVLVNGASADASTAQRGDTVTVTVSVAYSNVSWLPTASFLNNTTLTESVVMRHE